MPLVFSFFFNLIIIIIFLYIDSIFRNVFFFLYFLYVDGERFTLIFFDNFFSIAGCVERMDFDCFVYICVYI